MSAERRAGVPCGGDGWGLTGMLWLARSWRGGRDPAQPSWLWTLSRGLGCSWVGGKAKGEKCTARSPCGTWCAGVMPSPGCFTQRFPCPSGSSRHSSCRAGGPWSAWRWDPLPSQAAGEVVMYSGENAKGESFPAPGQALGFPGSFPCISNLELLACSVGCSPRLGAWLQPGTRDSREQSTSPALAARRR